MTSRDLHPPRRQPKRVLAVRMLAARIEWLDRQPRWHEGCVAWEGPEGRLVPGAADLARAERCLKKIASYPIAAELALGDHHAWLARRWERLDLAKRLRAFHAPDLPALARRVLAHDPEAVRGLVTLLTAEAVCLNSLPAAPSAALLACGPRAESPLRALLDDGAELPDVRRLAALTLGAIHRQGVGQRPRRPAPDLEDAGLRRAYAWGRETGLPPEPALIAALLARDEGPELARRCARSLQSRGLLSLPPELLRELLAEGTPPDQVVALAEAVVAAEPLAARMLERPGELPERPASERRALAQALRQQRQQAVADLARVLHDYARVTRDPALIPMLAGFTAAMLDLGDLTPGLADAILFSLQSGLELAPRLRRTYLEILADRLSVLAGPTALPGDNPRALEEWLRNHWHPTVRALRQLSRAAGEADVVRQAVARGLFYILARHEWRDPKLYQLFLALDRDLDLTEDEVLCRTLCEALDCFSSAAAARAALQPLLRALRPASPWLRRHFLESLLDSHWPRTAASLRDTFARLPRFTPRLLRFAEADTSDWCLCAPTAAAALALDAALPDQAEGWLEGLLSSLEERRRTAESGYEHVVALRVGVPLALALAGGDRVCFQRVVSAALQHGFSQEEDRLKAGLALLERFPALRAPLAQLFPQQPRRCAELLVRLGLTTRLGADALSPLAALEAPPGEEPPAAVSAAASPGWRELLELAPELAATAAGYRHAQRLLGGSPEPPPGVRRALALPRRLAGELSHLEELQARQPERADLAARAARLRARLADEARLRHTLRSEAGERLQQVAAEAQIAAAEQQVVACYRARLAVVAGPLPSGVAFDADLLNATLLAVEITRNRRLLRRLLRAHLSGNRPWRERHPANVRFVQELAERGVDTNVWLSASPRGYRCAGAAGSRVRLHLERDPVRILQMGNYFDTCLSFGGINAFATVANACELNKRVVYATDGAGRVVGRKLIGINEEGALIGFHTYSALTDPTGNEALRAIFRRYLADFAVRCGLRLADAGRVPTLFAEAWYDDGVVPWDEDDPRTAHSGSRSVHTPLRSHG